MPACRPNPLKRRRPNRGELNGQARLTATDIREIRRVRVGLRPGQRMPKDDPRSITSIAKRFGISIAHASRIILRFQWSHLP